MKLLEFHSCANISIEHEKKNELIFEFSFMIRSICHALIYWIDYMKKKRTENMFVYLISFHVSLSHSFVNVSVGFCTH